MDPRLVMGSEGPDIAMGKREVYSESKWLSFLTQSWLVFPFFPEDFI
jgi:hypothetical protein